MLTFLSIGIIVFSIFIFIQDFSSRKVLAILFPIITVFGLLRSLQLYSFAEVYTNFFFNVVISVLQFTVLFIFFSLKGKNTVKLSEKIGLGDALFMVTCCSIFPTTFFLVFTIASYIFTLLLHFAFLRFSGYVRYHTTIALAGWQALLVSILLLINFFLPVISVTESIVWFNLL